MSDNRITNAFTVDVEEYFHASALSKAVSRDRWFSMPSSVERCTNRILEILDERGIQGTFFVLGWVAEHYPGLIKGISAQGHEIACHGYSHELVYKQSRSVFEEETLKAKTILENLTGQPVLGYRAATFSITDEVSWAHDVLLELGFTYDSSIFPIRHDRYGSPGAPRFPFRVSHRQRQCSLVEFPMSTMQYGQIRIPVSGGGYFRLLPQTLTRFGLRRINEKERRPFIFYTHPWEIDDSQPRFDIGWVNRLRHYSNLDRCEARLRRLVADFRFGTCADVLRESGFDVATNHSESLVERASD